MSSSSATSVIGLNNFPNVINVPAVGANTTLNPTRYQSGTIFSVAQVGAFTLNFALPAPSTVPGFTFKVIVAVAPAGNTSLISLGTAAGANIYASLTGPNPVSLAVSSIVTLGITGATAFAVGDNFEVTSHGSFWVAKYVSTVAAAGMIIRTA
jgi:hypothetical protein